MRDCGGQLHCAKCDLPVKDLGSHASSSAMPKSQASQLVNSSLDAEKADLPSTLPLPDTAACSKIMHLTEATVYQKMQQCQQKLAVTNLETDRWTCNELLNVIGSCARTLQSLEMVRPPGYFRKHIVDPSSYFAGLSPIPPFQFGDSDKFPVRPVTPHVAPSQGPSPRSSSSA